MKCRFCQFTTTEFTDLRHHVGGEHFQQWMEIERWVDESTDGKIRNAATLAAQGMLGVKE